MKRKIITLLLTAALIASFALPTVSAAGLTNCSVLNGLNAENFDYEVLNEMLESQGCYANNASNNVASMDKLKETLQNQLNIQLDENCTNNDILEVLKNCNGNLNQVDSEMLQDLITAQSCDDVANTTDCTTTSTKDTTEVPPEQNCDLTVKAEEAADEMNLTVPTVDSTPDAEPIPTEAPAATATPIPTQAPDVEVTTVSTSTSVVATTPEPTAEPISEPTVESTPVDTDNSSAGISSIEQMMVNLVNQDRAAAGLSPLTIDAGLTESAREHSQDMSSNNFFSHTSPTNGSFSERLKNSNLGFMGAGENIALYNSVEKAQAGLMASDGHRANILGNYTHVGIGIVWNESKGAYYITQWFGRK